MIRKFIPASIKRNIRIAQRNRADRKSGIVKTFARAAKLPLKSVEIVSIEQPIYYNPLAANKVFNIGLAIKEIQQIVIQPKEVFSFWHIVGDPTKEKGYKTGRNIIGDSLKEDIGGGLCQVSGMIYHLALVSGMEIVERHNHTLDLYKEDGRYTPLGSDATVVFGYKDIRFKNRTSSPIYFNFNVSETNFIGSIFSPEHLPVFELNFQRKEFEGYRTIETYRRNDNTQAVLINKSKYLLP
ncbi:MAG: vancomycin resistance protein [Crocinitomix sp.]|nr:vancomycin resistance protein [Crocinitomix sp.]